MSLRTTAGPPARLALRGLVRARTLGWRSHSRLFAVGDRGGWSVDEDGRHLEAAARRLGYRVGPAEWARFASLQSIFLTSHFEALSSRWLGTSHRLATAYLHGRPGTAGAPEFDQSFELLRAHPRRFARIQVTHAEMHELVLSAGVPNDRIHRIPIGIDLESFPLGGEALKARAREKLGVPSEAFVVGSFQKDGVGWGDGHEPKLVKGPDVLVSALRNLQPRVPRLLVLLTGPARGYVRRELEHVGIPYRHVPVRTRRDLAQAYHALDVYIVSSRQEGGPKALLEAMAAGTPLVSTRVGQAEEVIEHGRSGWLVDVEDAEALAGWAAQVAESAPDGLREAGRTTAERYALDRLDGLWAKLLEGFVDREAA